MSTMIGSLREPARGDVMRGVAAGIVGGLVASWMMNRAQSALHALAPSPEPPAETSSGEQDDDATVKTARRLSRAILHHDLAAGQKAKAGATVHYAFGTSLGALYGGLAETMPVVRSGAGAWFGTAVWLVADEMAVPTFRLSKPPNQVPMSRHAYALGSHLLYGFTLETVRAGVRAALSDRGRDRQRGTGRGLLPLRGRAS